MRGSNQTNFPASNINNCIGYMFPFFSKTWPFSIAGGQTGNPFWNKDALTDFTTGPTCCRKRANFSINKLGSNLAISGDLTCILINKNAVEFEVSKDELLILRNNNTIKKRLNQFAAKMERIQPTMWVWVKIRKAEEDQEGPGKVLGCDRSLMVSWGVKTHGCVWKCNTQPNGKVNY